MDRYDLAIESYIKTFGDDDDICKYVSTWDYSKNDFYEFAIKIEKCVKCKKRYSKKYVSFLRKIYLNTIYTMLDTDDG